MFIVDLKSYTSPQTWLELQFLHLFRDFMLHTQKWQLRTDTGAIRLCVMHESTVRQGQESFSITAPSLTGDIWRAEKPKNRRYQISHAICLQIYYHKMEGHGDEPVI